MAIYAVKSGLSEIGGGSFRVELRDDLPHGAMLAYDATKDAFVDVCLTGSPVTGGISLGGTHSHTILSSNTLDGQLQFKEIIAGDGISIVSDDDSITISSDDAGGGLSVPDDFRITIDNDNDKSGDARFEIFTVTASDDYPLAVASSSMVALSSSNVFTGMSGDQGFFEARDADFWLHGFRPGMIIQVTNAGNQSGIWTIHDVENIDVGGSLTSRLILTEGFVDEAAYNLGGPKPDVRFEHFPVVIQQGGMTAYPYQEDLHYRLLAHGVDLGPDGVDFRPDMIVQITGTPDNDGIYTIASVEGADENGYSAILVNSNSPFLGTPGVQQSSSVTFEVRNVEESTGFYVTSGGHLEARHGHLQSLRVGSPQRGSYVPQSADAVVRNDNLDELRRSHSKALRYFFANI